MLRCTAVSTWVAHRSCCAPPAAISSKLTNPRSTPRTGSWTSATSPGGPDAWATGRWWFPSKVHATTCSCPTRAPAWPRTTSWTRGCSTQCWISSDGRPVALPIVKHFDLAIIGSGSGNSILDPRFDGLDVAILEQGVFGGTCLNVGCIPTKMYVYAADVARAVQHAQRFGVDAHIDGVRWGDIVHRVFGRMDPISAGGLRYREQGTPNTTLFNGHASFTGPKTID